METISLEQLYYFGELVGVIAVVASLLYVGKQLRQNTDFMRINAANVYNQWFFAMQSRLTDSREFADIWMKGESKFDDLDEIDKQRLMFHEWGAINSWKSYYDLRQSGLLPDTQWQNLLWAFNAMGRRQAVREAWKLNRDSYDKPFQDFITPYLE